MSAPHPLEEQMLKTASEFLGNTTAIFPEQFQYEARLQILECASARLGAFSVADYFKKFGIAPLFEIKDLSAHAAELLEKLKSLQMHPALALSSLSRKHLPSHAQREAGAYYTDFRLANFVAAKGKGVWDSNKPIVDPACGAGILLAATVIAICGADRKRTADFLANSVIAADSSPDALRGTCLALASLTNNLSAIVKMRSHWFLGDSLLRNDSEWKRVAPHGFGLVIANPPWEKIKVSRHEYAKAAGEQRHYGADHKDNELVGIESEQKRTFNYARKLAQQYPMAINGEVDLYVAFMELFLRLAKDGGGISALVPAGLIRSEGTTRLRKELLTTAKTLEVTILENRSRFFAIDTRFKFLSVTMQTRMESDSKSMRSLRLVHASGTDDGISISGEAVIPRKSLQRLRNDLTVPEVRSSKEWHLFAKMAQKGIHWHADDTHWTPDFCREIDMTKGKPLFRQLPNKGFLPLIEGRMVHQHRFGAKKHISGTGRKAVWAPLPVGKSRISPQHWIAFRDLPEKAKVRSTQLRAGFCDITGQTNERSMMAALIHPGVVCGNKVPTVVFQDDHQSHKLCLWVGMVNSLPFDWMMRRVLTTTVNYFLLRGVQLPSLEPTSLPGKEIIKAVQALQVLDVGGSSVDGAWQSAELRARIDLLCLIAYGAGYDDLKLILQDFPLLDRGQVALPGEAHSTITRDYLLLLAARRFRYPTAELLKRVNAAKTLGAIPYIPSQTDVTGEEQIDSRTG